VKGKVPAKYEKTLIKKPEGGGTSPGNYRL
jgi:hypothetical protein